MKQADAPFQPLPEEEYVAPAIPHPYGLSEADSARVGYWDAKVDGLSVHEPVLSEAVQQKVTTALYGPVGGPSITLPDVLVGGTVGYPTGGCLAEGRKAVYGDLKTYADNSNFIGNFNSTILDLASQNPQMRDLDKAWSDCMRKAGHPSLDSPGKARDEAVKLLPKNPSMADWAVTKPLAVADARCEESIDYAAKREHLEDRYFSAGLAKFEARLSATREMYTSAKARAQRALLARS